MKRRRSFLFCLYFKISKILYVKNMKIKTKEFNCENYVCPFFTNSHYVLNIYKYLNLAFCCFSFFLFFYSCSSSASSLFFFFLHSSVMEDDAAFTHSLHAHASSLPSCFHLNDGTDCLPTSSLPTSIL